MSLDNPVGASELRDALATLNAGQLRARIATAAHFGELAALRVLLMERGAVDVPTEASLRARAAQIADPSQ